MQRWHLGADVYASIGDGFRFLHLRKFYMDKKDGNLKATQFGIGLRFNECMPFVEGLPQLECFHVAIKEAQWCR